MFNKTATTLLLALLITSTLIASIGVFQFSSPNASESHFHSPILKEKVPEEFLDLIENANEMVLINLINDENQEYVKVSDSDMALAKELILSDESYLFNSIKFSMFIPSVEIIFRTGDQTCSLLFSHHAKKIKFLNQDGQLIEMIDLREEQFATLESLINNYIIIHDNKDIK